MLKTTAKLAAQLKAFYKTSYEYTNYISLLVTSARFIAQSARLNGLNHDYSKLKKEEVIYKVRFIYKYRVLPLYTAYASRASARDYMTWNAKTVTLPPPFRESLSSSFVFYNRIIDFVVSS
jgi:hypothetical protein